MAHEEEKRRRFEDGSSANHPPFSSSSLRVNPPPVRTATKFSTAPFRVTENRIGWGTELRGAWDLNRASIKF
jgi:hypothetical protein